jgi:RHS repeat-associated protein
LNGQYVYTFDANPIRFAVGLRGNLLQSDVLSNTFDAANRLTASTRDSVTVQPIYNGVNDRVGQTVGLTTTYFALGVQGLPEVIYTTAGEAYLHLPGVIMTESSGGEVRYLLGDGLGSIRQAVDETAEIVSYYEFDPYGNPVNNTGGDPYGYTGEWYEGYLKLLHLRARWLMPETGTFLSKDAFPGFAQRPATLHAYVYGANNPINRTDPSGYQDIPGTAGAAIVTCFGIAFAVPEPFFIEEGICTLIALGLVAASPVIAEPVVDAVDELIDIANEAWENWQEPEPKNEPTPPPVP